MNGYGQDELVVASTPLRLTLGGGGTDLPLYADRFGGDIVTAAISLWVTVVARQGRFDGLYRYSHERTEISDRPSSFRNAYVREALDMLRIAEPCEVVSMGPVPAGTGLGSSGAFAVSLLAALSALRGLRPSGAELAEQAHELEVRRLGMPIGRQDHYACALGGLRRLMIGTDGQVRTELLCLPPGVARQLNRRLLLFYTGQRRDSAIQLAVPREAVELSQRIADLHQIRKVGDETRVALENGALAEIPPLIAEHWRIKQTREASRRWDDYLLLACQNGALAGKIVGAGGGGFLLLFVDPAASQGVVTAMTSAGLQHAPYHFVETGTTVTMLSHLGPAQPKVSP
jgi:D-glycero-alpha-D-manno-heptose-7-phosphate kinase